MIDLNTILIIISFFVICIFAVCISVDIGSISDSLRGLEMYLLEKDKHDIQVLKEKEKEKEIRVRL